MGNKLFDSVELSDEMLEGVSGGLLDLFKDNEPIVITTADMVASCKEQGMNKEQTKATIMDMINRFNALSPLFSEADIARIMAEIDACF